jgi:hypothetical protein
MAINYNDRTGVLGINLTPQDNSYQDFAFKPGSVLDNQINKLYQLEEMGFPQPNLQKLKDMDMKQFKEKGTPLSLPSDAYTAMAISNYDDLFGPQTFTDALGTTRTLSGLDKPDINTAPFNVNEGVTNTNSFRSMLLDDLRNLPSDLRTSLGQTKDALVEDFSGLKNFAQNIGSKGIDYGRTAIDGILSAVTGIPGIGLLLRGINPNPPSKIEYDYLSQSGYSPQLKSIYGPGGIMENYNAISAFGPGPINSIINRRNKILARIEAGKSYGKVPLEKLNQAIADLGVSEYRASRPESERNVTGPSGGGRDNTGGDIGSKGAADQFSNKSGFGRTGY